MSNIIPRLQTEKKLLIGQPESPIRVSLLRVHVSLNY
jgi:hypothetical protein